MGCLFVCCLWLFRLQESKEEEEEKKKKEEEEEERKHLSARFIFQSSPQPNTVFLVHSSLPCLSSDPAFTSHSPFPSSSTTTTNNNNNNNNKNFFFLSFPRFSNSSQTHTNTHTQTHIQTNTHTHTHKGMTLTRACAAAQDARCLCQAGRSSLSHRPHQ